MALTCPITKEIMVDPVIAADGHTYERHAIEMHMKLREGGFNSPMTQEHFSSKKLISNHFVKSMIAEFIDNTATEAVKADWRATCADVKAARKGLDGAQLFGAGKFEEAAALGHMEARIKLANDALNKIDPDDVNEADSDACIKYAQMLNDDGRPAGAFILGQLYFKVKNYSMARAWFSECAREVPNAYFMLGVMAPPEEREKYFLKGCRYDDPDCLFEIARSSFEVAKYSVARRYYKKLAQGESIHKYAAMFKLGGMCIQGRGGEVEYSKGQQLVFTAAEAGHPGALKLRALNLSFDFFKN